MKRNEIKKERKKRIRWWRIIALVFLITGIVMLAVNINKKNQQDFHATILPVVNVAEQPEQNLDELIKVAQSQNIPLPKEIQEKMAEEQRLKEEEEKRIAEEKAKAEAEQKAKEEAEAKKKAEELRIAQSKQVTSRGGTSVRTATGTKAEYQAYAKNLCINTYGWTENDFNCLVKLWERESNWNPNAHNKSSGAHGICQALPASKMASEGSDYMTNYKTQIRWGLKYIKNRYGTPANAWAHSQQKGWY